jgi:hypothetical protein
VFEAAGKVLNSSDGSVILPLRLVEFHAGPKTAGELGAATEL